MRKFLLAIGVLQKKRFDGYKTPRRRINPYNPLSYIVIAITLVIAVFWIGVEGIKENSYNPFKWQ